MTVLRIRFLSKKILNFIGPRSNDVFNVSHPKGFIFLTRLRTGLSHPRKHTLKHGFLDTLSYLGQVIQEWTK